MWIAFAYAAFLLAIGYLSSLWPPSPATHDGEPFDEGTSDLLHEMGLQDGNPVARRLAAYAAFAASHPAPWTSVLEARVALATYNSGVDLQETGSLGEAVKACLALDRDFARSTVREARLYTARGLVNLASSTST